jgi:hypothetical protein
VAVRQLRQPQPQKLLLKLLLLPLLPLLLKPPLLLLLLRCCLKLLLLLLLLLPLLTKPRSLTSGTDALTFSSADNTITAGEVTTGGVAATDVLSLGDEIDGGGGTDTLRLLSSDAITALPVGLALTSVENLTVLGGNTVTLNTTAAGVASVTDVSVLGAVGAITVTAAATQDLSVTDTSLTGNVIANGGKDVTCNSWCADYTDYYCWYDNGSSWCYCCSGRRRFSRCQRRTRRHYRYGRNVDISYTDDWCANWCIYRHARRYGTYW